MEDLLAFLHRAERLLVFTGAGISTSSGIPDFRGPQGIWKTRRPVYFSEFLSSDEARVEYWDYKLESWPSMRDAEPNVAHRAIVSLHEAGKLLAVVTQNIDGLHQKAGLSEELVIELHGTNRWNALLAKGVLSRSRSSMHSPRRHGLRVAGIVRDGLSRQLSVLDRILTRRR